MHHAAAPQRALRMPSRSIRGSLPTPPARDIWPVSRRRCHAHRRRSSGCWRAGEGSNSARQRFDGAAHVALAVLEPSWPASYRRSPANSLRAGSGQCSPQPKIPTPVRGDPLPGQTLAGVGSLATDPPRRLGGLPDTPPPIDRRSEACLACWSREPSPTRLAGPG